MTTRPRATVLSQTRICERGTKDGRGTGIGRERGRRLAEERGRGRLLRSFRARAQEGV